jgi:hypothetical protein
VREQRARSIWRIGGNLLFAVLLALGGGCDDSSSGSNPSGAGGGQPTPPQTLGEASAASGKSLADAAISNVGKLNSNIGPQTDYGNLGCAWAVDQIVKAQTGVELDTLSTAEMYNELRNGMGIAVDANNPPPGAIIISPTTEGGSIGHAGIVGYDGLVYSNSSRDAVWEQNYSVASWHRYFDAKGIGTFAFVVKNQGGG